NSTGWLVSGNSASISLYVHIRLVLSFGNAAVAIYGLISLLLHKNQDQEVLGVRLNVSVTKSAAPKAAEGQPQSKTCRNLHGARSREASWTAAVLLPLLSRRLNHTREERRSAPAAVTRHSTLVTLHFFSSAS